MIIMSLVNIMYVILSMCNRESILVSDRGPTFHVPLSQINNRISIHKKS